MPFSSVRLLSPRLGALSPLALAALCLAGSAHAQSLQDLYDAAHQYDATYLAVRAATDSAQYRADQTMALRLPGVQLTAGVSRSTSDTPYTTPKSSETNAHSATLSASQNVFNRANDITIDQADKAVVIAQSQLRAAEQDLIVRLAQAYFDVLASSDALDTVRANKAAIKEQLASAQRNFEVGTATITDTREAQAAYDLALAQELAADNDLRVKRVALEQLVGRDNLQPRPLAVPVVLPLLAPASVDPWVITADANNPTIEQARLGLDVAKLETSKARAGHLPTVALTGSYTKGHLDTDTSSGSLKGNNGSSAIGLTVTVPLFAGFATQNRIKETLSLEDQSVNNLEAARRGVAQGTRTAFFGVQSGMAQIKALEAAEVSSKLALDATKLGYEVGVRVNLDVLNAQTKLYTTQRDLAKARYDVILGKLKLRQASGELNPSDIAAANALLAK